MPTNHRAFVNINYSDDIESVLTLAHEAGHMLSHNIKQKNNIDNQLKNGIITNAYANAVVVQRLVLHIANVVIRVRFPSIAPNCNYNGF